MRRVCVVGSGPAGLYAVQELLKRPNIAVDVLEQLPVPFGLIRAGVAPDHPEVKVVADKLAESFVADAARCRFLGNIEFGATVRLPQLQRAYDAVLLACGASEDRRLGIPGEDTVRGVHAARSFVAWYNGHPAHAENRFPPVVPADPTAFRTRRAVIVGQGNVAIDVARLLARQPASLATTDIAAHALAALTDVYSSLDEIVLLGRRSSAHAAFTTAELRELTKLDGCDVVVDPSELLLDPVSASLLSDRAKQRQHALLQQISKRTATQRKRIVFRFLRAPVAVVEKNGVVSGLLTEKTTITDKHSASFLFCVG
eukprot:TRINITY_DN8161_c0_g1_i3.p1 TRINITY_DN8161_c0_g1~~TRINITY_DN8161_c0_g1_i3.p1  ORF type:complete len:314 (+),score=74.80 TRINITY_DN8161_c0_g1_i3:18-959(+)